MSSPAQSGQRAGGLRSLARLLPQVDRASSAALAVGIVVSAALPVTVAIVTGRLVGSIPPAVVGGFGSAAGRTTLALLGGVAACVLGQRALGPALYALSSSLGRRVERTLQERVMKSVARPSGVAHLEDPLVLDLLRVLRGLGMDRNRPQDAVRALARVLPSWLQALASAVVLAVFHWWLGLVWLLVWPILLSRLQREYLKVGEVSYGQSAALRRAEYLRDLALTPAAAKELRVWGLLDWLIARFRDAWSRAIEPVWRARRFSPPVLWTTSGTLLVVNLASYALLAVAGAHGNISLAALAVFTQAMAGVNSFLAFDDDNAALAFGVTTVPKVLALDAALHGSGALTTPVPPGPGAAIPAALPDGAPRRSIRFDRVTFCYPHADRDALSALDLTIEAGRSLAIVGVNGAGKSSLVKVLGSLYAPTAGRVLVDGIDIADVRPADWQRRIAVLFQDFARFQLTARDNISLGVPDLDGTFGSSAEDAVRAAAERAGALDLVESLPNGFDTVLSRQYDGGVDLSVGQWQRVALARAMLAVSAGATVLVLDEPTAALDVRAEAELYDRFLEITAGLTTILISHRFSTVRRVDRIVVLDAGGIREDGSHDQLVALRGRYAHMFELQAARFRDRPAEDAAAGEGELDA